MSMTLQNYRSANPGADQITHKRYPCLHLAFKENLYAKKDTFTSMDLTVLSRLHPVFADKFAVEIRLV